MTQEGLGASLNATLTLRQGAFKREFWGCCNVQNVAIVWRGQRDRGGTSRKPQKTDPDIPDPEGSQCGEREAAVKPRKGLFSVVVSRGFVRSSKTLNEKVFQGLACRPAQSKNAAFVVPQLEMEKAFLRLETMERTYEERAQALFC